MRFEEKIGTLNDQNRIVITKEIGSLLNPTSILGTTIDSVRLCLMDVNQSGILLVSLIDGHLVGLNQQYLNSDISGNLIDQFAGPGEGAFVGTFGVVDLFISYKAGSGNDIALCTPVTEPNSAVL